MDDAVLGLSTTYKTQCLDFVVRYGNIAIFGSDASVDEQNLRGCGKVRLT